MHIAKKSARGSVVLFAGNFIATAIAAVASMAVALRVEESGDFEGEAQEQTHD